MTKKTAVENPDLCPCGPGECLLAKTTSNQLRYLGSADASTQFNNPIDAVTGLIRRTEQIGNIMCRRKKLLRSALNRAQRIRNLLARSDQK